MPRTAIKFVWFAMCGVIAASVWTYARYQSLSPCDWMEQDLARQTDLPRLVVQSQIRADFLVQGIVDPDPYDCVRAWWRFRADGVAEGS